MRSLGLFACCWFLVACDDGNGTDVTIVVTAPSGFTGDTVQVILGKSAGDEVAAIAPEGLKPRDGVYALSAITTYSTAIAAGETVELSLDLGDIDTVDAVVALAGPGIATNADGMRYVASPTATAFRYRVGKLAGDDYTKYELDLAPATPASDATDAPNQVLLWGAQGQYPVDQRCVYLRDNAPEFHPAQAAQLDTNGDGAVDATDDAPLRGLFIVTRSDDRDCDGFAKDDPLECSPDVYLDQYATTPHLDELNCLAQDNGTGPSACRLGGPGCIDGRGSDPNSCVGSRYCATTELCGCRSAANPLDCLRDLVQANQGMLNGYYLDCTIWVPYVAAGQISVCTSSATVDIPVGCESDVLGATRTAGFSTELVWENQKIQLTTAHDANTCRLTITPGGQLVVPDTGAMEAPRGAVLVANVPNGSGLAIPARFTFQPESTTMAEPCSTVSNFKTSCTLIGTPDSTLSQCLAGPPP